MDDRERGRVVKSAPGVLFQVGGGSAALVEGDEDAGSGGELEVMEFAPVHRNRQGLITLKPDQMYAVVEMVSPERAARILAEANTGTETLRQRNRSEASIADQMGWMTRGEWRPVPPGIVYDTENRLLNAQHGLTAQVRVGMTLPWWVTYNCLPEIFPFIDTGKKRTIGDALFMNMVIEKAGSGGHLGSALRLMCTYEDYQAGLYPEQWPDWCKRRLSHTQMLAVLARRPLIGESLAFASRMIQRDGYNRAALTVFHRLVLDKYPRDAGHVEDFVEQVMTGRRTEKGDPADTLRGWWSHGAKTVLNIAQNHRTTRERALFALIWAWNLYAAGERFKRGVRIAANDPMPEPRGMRKLSTTSGSGGRA